MSIFYQDYQMEPIFPRINYAIDQTCAYYKIGMIGQHFSVFEGDTLYLSHLDYRIESTFTWHKHMESEIYQTINTANVETKHYLYEYLVSWVGDYHIKSVNVGLIESEIDAYNERVYSEFLEKYKADEAAFLNHEDYNKWAHLEEYETSNTSDPIFKKYFTNRHTHYKYYCIKDKIPFIDKKFLPDYIELITPIIQNFRNILLKHTKENSLLYNAARLPNNNTFYINEPQRQIEVAKESPPPDNATTINKIKFNLTVEQLAFLFKLLKATGIIEAKTDMEITRFISQNFETPKTSDKGISKKQLANSFSTTDAKTANYWITKLREMITKAGNL